MRSFFFCSADKLLSASERFGLDTDNGTSPSFKLISECSMREINEIKSSMEQFMNSGGSVLITISGCDFLLGPSALP